MRTSRPFREAAYRRLTWCGISQLPSAFAPIQKAAEDTAPYTHLRSCGITRLKGGNNKAQGNALGIADGPGEALKGRHTGTQPKTSAEGRTKEARGYFAPSTFLSVRLN
jgi:hypothetical protein